MIGFINLYFAGYYHRAGKPGSTSLHGGDIYPTREAALADIEREARDLGVYIGTAPVDLTQHGSVVREAIRVHAPDSTPLPLNNTRAMFKLGARPSDVASMLAPKGGGRKTLPAHKQTSAQDAPGQIVNPLYPNREADESSIETSEADAIEPTWGLNVPWGIGRNHTPNMSRGHAYTSGPAPQRAGC